MLTLYYMPVSREKLLDEVSPSEPTNSVELGEWKPPSNNAGPPFPSTSQHTWMVLLFTSRIEVGLKTPVRGFSFRQDRSSPEKTLVKPPQRRLLQRLCWYLPLPGGRSTRRQEWRVWGLKTSTLTPTDFTGNPPAMITPGTKCIHILVKTIIHCHVILFKSLGAHLGSKLLIDFFFYWQVLAIVLVSHYGH